MWKLKPALYFRIYFEFVYLRGNKLMNDLAEKRFIPVALLSSIRDGDPKSIDLKPVENNTVSAPNGGVLTLNSLRDRNMAQQWLTAIMGRLMYHRNQW